MESDLRGRFRRSPGGLPAHPALGQRVSWEAQGTDVVQGSGVLPRPPTSSGPGLEAAVNLSPIPPLRPNSGLYLGRNLWDLVPPVRRPEETEGQLSWAPGSLRNDSWTGVGTRPWGSRQLSFAPLRQDWDLGEWTLYPGTLPLCQERE